MYDTECEKKNVEQDIENKKSKRIKWLLSGCVIVVLAVAVFCVMISFKEKEKDMERVMLPQEVESVAEEEDVLPGSEMQAYEQFLHGERTTEDGRYLTDLLPEPSGGWNGRVDMITYAYLDLGNDGISELLVTFIGMDLYANEDDSTLEYVLRYDDELEVCYQFETWDRCETEISYYGVIESGGSSGATSHSFFQTMLDADGNAVEIYAVNIEEDLELSLRYEPFRSNGGVLSEAPDAGHHIYQIGENYYLRYDEVMNENRAGYEEFYEFYSEKGYSVRSADEIEVLIADYAKQQGIESWILEDETEPVVQTLERKWYADYAEATSEEKEAVMQAYEQFLHGERTTEDGRYLTDLIPTELEGREWHGEVDAITYAYLDLGNDGMQELLVTLVGMDQYSEGDDSTLEYILRHDGENIVVCYEFETWYAQNTDVAYYGVVQMSGTDGGCHYGELAVLDGHGNLVNIYTMDMEFGSDAGLDAVTCSYQIGDVYYMVYDKELNKGRACYKEYYNFYDSYGYTVCTSEEIGELIEIYAQEQGMSLQVLKSDIKPEVLILEPEWYSE